MVKRYCKMCEDCQRQGNRFQSDTVFSTYTSVLFEKDAVDVVKMLKCKGKGYIVVVREDLSGWVKARSLKQATLRTVYRGMTS